jgi:hypothetical protein
MARLVRLFLYDALGGVGAYRFLPVFAEVCSHSPGEAE